MNDWYHIISLSEREEDIISFILGVDLKLWHV